MGGVSTKRGYTEGKGFLSTMRWSRVVDGATDGFGGKWMLAVG